MNLKNRNTRFVVNLLLGLAWVVLGYFNLMKEDGIGWLDYGYLLVGCAYIVFTGYNYLKK